MGETTVFDTYPFEETARIRALTKDGGHHDIILGYAIHPSGDKIPAVEFREKHHDDEHRKRHEISGVVHAMINIETDAYWRLASLHPEEWRIEQEARMPPADGEVTRG